MLGVEAEPDDYPAPEDVNRRGFFIGLHTEHLGDATVAARANIMLSYDFGPWHMPASHTQP